MLDQLLQMEIIAYFLLIGYRMDVMLGKWGIFLKHNFPRLYLLIKKVKK